MNGESNVGKYHLYSSTPWLPVASVAAFGFGGLVRSKKPLMVGNEVTKLSLLD